MLPLGNPVQIGGVLAYFPHNLHESSDIDHAPEIVDLVPRQPVLPQNVVQLAQDADRELLNRI